VRYARLAIKVVSACVYLASCDWSVDEFQQSFVYHFIYSIMSGLFRLKDLHRNLEDSNPLEFLPKQSPLYQRNEHLKKSYGLQSYTPIPYEFQHPLQHPFTLTLCRVKAIFMCFSYVSSKRIFLQYSSVLHMQPLKFLYFVILWSKEALKVSCEDWIGTVLHGLLCAFYDLQLGG
jgi:hypothetical protein